MIVETYCCFTSRTHYNQCCSQFISVEQSFVTSRASVCLHSLSLLKKEKLNDEDSLCINRIIFLIFQSENVTSD
nr:MAG TPA: hypothetical protein [Caudoviricetes sp.]